MRLLEIPLLALAMTVFSLGTSLANPLGWVYRPFLACDKFVEHGELYGKCEVADPTGTPLNIRTLPSAKSGRTVASIANDTTVVVLDRSGDWLFIGEFDYDCKLTSDLFGPPERQTLGPLHCAPSPEK